MEDLTAKDRALGEEWLRLVKPSDRRNPSPKPKYDLVVIGAGTAGLVSAGGAAMLGARVALIERDKMGGDCLNTGCVPSKALIHEAREAWTRRRLVPGFDAKAFFREAMVRVRAKRTRIAPHDSVKKLEEYGVDVFLGQAVFTDMNKIEVAGRTLRFRKAVVATGGRPARPKIPGLENIPYHTNESIFEITELPDRLTLIGGGPIGCEMSQAFQRFGTQVTLVQSASRLLDKENEDASAVLTGQLMKEGVKVMLSARVVSAQGSGGKQTLLVASDGIVQELESDLLLIAAGRTPNVDGLELETAGIRYDASGIQVDDFLRTSNKRVFACGDVASRYKFTHVAHEQARLVVQNALLFGRKRASRLVIPWVTYTDPEVARVGKIRAEAEKEGKRTVVIRVDFSHEDRSILEDEESGFAEAVLEKGTDRILGLTLVHRHAGELISEGTLAMANGLGLSSFSKIIHPYPTRSEILRKLGDKYRLSKLTPFLKKILGLVIRR